MTKEHDVLLRACLKLQPKSVHAIAYFRKNKDYKIMGNWTELADAITELLLNSGYVADEGSHNNDANAPRNDVNINIGL